MADIQQIHVNGTVHTLDQTDPDRSLLSVLRDELDLTGTHYGCGEGQCGACTVLIDGQPTRSCITPIGSVAKHRIVTIEGLETNGALQPIQEAFLEEDAMQCGYCTSGMIMSAAALLRQHPSPTDPQIVNAMQGNVCRCGTYRRIVRAIRLAAQRTRRAAR